MSVSTKLDVHVCDMKTVRASANFFPPHSGRKDGFATVEVFVSSHETSYFFNTIEQAEAFSAMIAAAVTKLRKEHDAEFVPNVE